MRTWPFFFFKKGDFCQYIPSPCTKGMLRVDFTCKGNWSIGIRRHWLGEAISSGAYFICTIDFSSQKVPDDRLSSNWNSHLTRMADSGGWELAHIVNCKEKFTCSELEFHSCICGQTINQQTAFMKFPRFYFFPKRFAPSLTYSINQGSHTGHLPCYILTMSITASAMQPVPALGRISRFSALFVSGSGWCVCLLCRGRQK